MTSGWRARHPAPAELAIPPWLVALVTCCMAAAAVLGYVTADAAPLGIVRATFFGSAAGYLAVSIVDFREHFQLERAATGRALSFVAIPIGETLNHWATITVLGLLLGLARPLPPDLAARDWFVLAAAPLFLALGWRDELVYHRRRAKHREDIMHTVAHLAAATMLGSFLVMRMARW